MNRRPFCANLPFMEQRHTLHIIDSSSRTRAELSRLGFELGHHCEVYGGLAELLERPPASGVLLIGDGDAADGAAAAAVSALTRVGCWLPVIALHAAPTPERIVAAVRMGVLDYLALPLDPAVLSGSLRCIGEEVAAHGEARRQAVAAGRRVADLSPREREVLDWLTRGCSNKVIARELTISPRTVEIHRANMMTKLGARHSAEAIRLRLEAEPVVRLRAIG